MSQIPAESCFLDAEGQPCEAGSAVWQLVVNGGYHPPADLLARMWECTKGADLILASRHTRQGYRDGNVLGQFASRNVARFARFALDLGVDDVLSPIRLYRISVMRALDIEPGGDLKGSGVRDIVKLYANGYTIHEVPYFQRKEHLGHGRSFSEAAHVLLTIWKLYRLRNTVTFADYDQRAWSSIIPLQRYWHRTRFRHSMRFLGEWRETDPSPILDVGCGTGHMLYALPHAVCLDIDMRKLRHSRRAHRNIFAASVTHLPFPDQSFKRVICMEVIEHIEDMEGPLDELARVTAPGGTLVVGTPDYATWQWNFIEWCYARAMPGAYADEHISHFTRKSLTEKLEARGFDVIDHDYVLHADLIVKAVKRRGGGRQRRQANGPDGH